MTKRQSRRPDIDKQAHTALIDGTLLFPISFFTNSTAPVRSECPSDQRHTRLAQRQAPCLASTRITMSDVLD